MRSFFSRAKVILLGEYAVLHGADALCLPLKTGQHLNVENNSQALIHWKWSYKHKVLADFTLEPETLELNSTAAGNPQWAVSLIKLIRNQQPGFLKTNPRNLHFINYFPPEWGLGSSSATISALCRLADANPYLVNQKLMGGSGADIACATAHSWVLYRNHLPEPPRWELPFDYALKEYTYFIYSGKKQATAEHLENVRSGKKPSHAEWDKLNHYVYRFLGISNVIDAVDLLQTHEDFIAQRIGMQPLANSFPDFPGAIKSLGAWGGDFFMALSNQPAGFVKDYFIHKGYPVVFTWEELVENQAF